MNGRLIQDLIVELFREFGASAAIVVSSGIVVWTNISNQSVIPNLRIISKDTKIIHRKTITTRVEMSENKIYEKIYETEQALQQQTYRTENALEKKLEQAKQELGQGIDRAQAVATGSALAILDDPKKVAPMQERLKAFAACVRGGGGESCLKGKQELIDSPWF